jgi:acylphosphatase
MIKLFKIRISGKVQGVFFRTSAKEEADRLGIYGFVKNEKDGTVYIEAQGEETTLNDFLKWCYQGPPSAKVEDLVKIEAPVKNFTSFEDRREK